MIATARFWLALLVIAMLAYGGGRWQQSRADAVAYDAERTKAALSAAVDQVRAVDLARGEEQRRTAAQTEIANAAIQNAKVAQADARVADAARRELLARLTAFVNASRRPGDSAPIGGSEATRDPIVVLADVFSRADARAGELAATLDAARVAGQACERSYDALTAPAGS